MSDGSEAEILVVDDDALSRRLLAQLLTAAGYKCLVCEDGSKALQIIHAKPPSLLLLDFAKTASAGPLGCCYCLSSRHPGRRSYLWMATNEGWQDFVLYRRWHWSRGRCGSTHRSGKPSFSLP